MAKSKHTKSRNDGIEEMHESYRERKAAEEEWNTPEMKLLRSVPLRGTDAWERREALRAKLGCRCISWGSLEWARLHQTNYEESEA